MSNNYREKINFGEWYVMRTKNSKFALFYERGVIEEAGGLIDIDSEIFEKAKSWNYSLESLNKQYELTERKKLLTLSAPQKIAAQKRKNTANKFYGRGYILTKTSDRYFIQYQISAHGGGIREFEITKKIFEYGKDSNLAPSDIFKKFNLYHLDVPENNVK